MTRGIIQKTVISLLLISIFFISGCACNKSWKQGFIKGALTGVVVGGAGGYAASHDPNEDGEYAAIGAVIGYVVGGLVGSQVNKCETVAVAEQVKDVDSDGDGVIDRLDQCPDTPAGVKVDYKGCPVDTDKDGVPDYEDKCPGTPAGVKVDSNGCPVDTDKDGVPDYEDKCPGTPEGAKVDARGCWVLEGVNFDTNKATIKAMSYPALDEVVNVLKENPALKLEIQGYTDSVGTEKYNQRLSEKRAKSVYEYFVKKGVNSSQLTYKGYGEAAPIASNDTDEGRAKNRRVELKPLP